MQVLTEVRRGLWILWSWAIVSCFTLVLGIEHGSSTGARVVLNY